MKNWQKAMAGLLLLGGFTGYTQYQKSAEPVWKVNEEEFSVVKSLDEVKNSETFQYPPVLLANYFNLLQKGPEALQLPGDRRNVKIENYWFVDTSLYLLYSVNLKKTDKNERYVPELSVKEMTYILPDGTEEEFISSWLNEEHSSSEYVYKHRLYRSILLTPQINNVEAVKWEQLVQAKKVKLDGLTMSSKKGERTLDSITLKLNVFNSQQVLGSSPVDEKITFPGSGNLNADRLDITYYEPFLRLSGVPVKQLVGFGGGLQNSQHPEDEIFEVQGPDEKGLYIPLHFYDMAQAMTSTEQSQNLTFDRVFFRTDESLTWKVTASEIAAFNKKNEMTNENQLVGTKAGITVYKKGFFYDGADQKLITFNLSHKNEEMDVTSYHVMRDNVGGQSESGDPILTVNEERMLKNVISIKNSKGEKVENFEVYPVGNGTYGISFIIDEKQELPEEDLTITLSHIVGTEKLPKEVRMQLEFPKRK
ncbi:hypothetical protein ACFQPF_03280 [Fictibacillus iocasae]|uniref:DUF4179 domain-containing protein n=1 Tax=Fictibacillus iocasae TaxID=2715437 RepID=A0ABW2NNA7_9BACL